MCTCASFAVCPLAFCLRALTLAHITPVDGSRSLQLASCAVCPGRIPTSLLTRCGSRASNCSPAQSAVDRLTSGNHLGSLLMPLLLLGCLGFLPLRCSHSTATCLPNLWLPQPRALRPCAPCAGARSHVDDGRTQQQEHQLIDHGRRILSHEVLVPSIQASAASNARLNQLSGQGQQLAARVRDLESAVWIAGTVGR